MSGVSSGPGIWNLVLMRAGISGVRCEQRSWNLSREQREWGMGQRAESREQRAERMPDVR